ncbi:MAG: ROK family protein [bacterium]
MSVIGADLGGTNFRAGLVSDGALAKTACAAIDGGAPMEKVLAELYRLIDGFAAPGLEGIGVGCPSLVDLVEGIIYDTTNIPSWKEVPLKSLLEKRYRVPVRVDNDANCFVVGEKHFGKAKDFSSAVGLIMGTGLGAGLILNNRLYSGRNCGAGEFGMLPYLDGNFEDYCCGRFFMGRGTSGKEAFALARAGDASARALFSEFGRHVGEVVKAVLYALDPELIIFGGSVSKAHEFFFPAIRESLKSFGYTRALARLHIEVSETDNIAILGAAALYYDSREGGTL